jgi:hypothetical protein
MNVLLPVLLLLLGACPPLRAGLGESQDQSRGRYGKPVREALETSGLLYFEKDGLCYIAHFHKGQCDVLSIFLAKEEFGFPVALPQERVEGLLVSEGGGKGWEPLPGTTINRVWDSPDKKSFAIYDTMRQKLVLMTREAYHREKEARKTALEEAAKEAGKTKETPSPLPSPSQGH